ncbi:MerC domain-containing protein [Panacibacter sp. DH6]|uniref:MerC domain-containing protein n=1 Tax=Panacibacter microcysteis TaxID=2793269 RepID=A0A931GXH7_9BACT|nr:MerC domain-containing protein [Panacibacter microcysteis]MBG9375749.1 MerC domain-containing protein [Panacibacter microcysteis]
MNMKINWDALGITASVACAIHCALLPLFLTSLPLFGVEIIDNFSFEIFMIIVAMAIGSYSFYHGFKKHHHSIVPFLLFLAGIGLLFAKQVWHEYQVWFLIPAVILIVVAHFTNYRSCRVHNHAHSDDCDH